MTSDVSNRSIAPAVGSVIETRCENVNPAVRSCIAPVDPITYPGWDQLLSRRNDSSFFHTSSWARVLHGTYGHRPFYFSRISNDGLEELLPVMEVSSWVTGRRGVSLPFTDVCPALKSTAFDRALYDTALDLGRRRGWKYFESRNQPNDWPEAQPSVSFYCHTIDLGNDCDGVFKRLASSMRRGIRKAQEAGVQIEFDTRPEAISLYYSLHCHTRRRHGVPPQPFRFFENIGRYVLEPGKGFVGIARCDKKPIAAGVYFHFGKQAFYKFGASDPHFQHLRPNNLLMWEAIKHCITIGSTSLHLGRTSLVNEGLRRFKQSFGGNEEQVSYARYDFKRMGFAKDVDRAEGGLNHLFRCLPAPLFRLLGGLIYPHLS